jgi:hypothetical protein
LTQGHPGIGLSTLGVMTLGAQSMTNDSRTALRLRRALALPRYAIALILSFASDMLGSLAAKIAGDD